jgi:hypothetical protein
MSLYFFRRVVGGIFNFFLDKRLTKTPLNPENKFRGVFLFCMLWTALA